jgi:hypothetical protein
LLFHVPKIPEFLETPGFEDEKNGVGIPETTKAPVS